MESARLLRQCAVGESFGHRPTERDLRVAARLIKRGEALAIERRFLRFLRRFEVKQPCQLLVARDHEGPIVKATFGPETLGETATPRPLFPARLVLRAGDDVLEAGKGT